MTANHKEQISQDSDFSAFLFFHFLPTKRQESGVVEIPPEIPI